MKVLVTGAGGFIGSHVAVELARRGHEVVGLDNGYTATHDELDGVVMERGDVTDLDQVLVAGEGCDVVVHMAGLLGTHEIQEQGLTNLANTVNINGTVNVLELCRREDARMVLSTKPNPDDWMNPYTITKAAAESYCIMYAREYGVPAIALSLMWVYGKEQRQEPVNKFIPTFMKHAIEGTPVPIWNDGLQVIDCTYIDDVVEAFVRAAELERRFSFLRIDVGTGRAVTVLEVAQKVIEVVGSESEIEFVGKRLGEPLGSAIAADTSGCKKHLGFVPGITLDEGLAECYEWYKEKF